VSTDRGGAPILARSGLTRAGQEFVLRWTWPARVGPIFLVIVVVGTDLGHHHSTADWAALLLFGGCGLVVQFSRDRDPLYTGELPAIIDKNRSRLHAAGVAGLFVAAVALCFLQVGLTGDVGMLVALLSSSLIWPVPAVVALAIGSAAVVGVSQGLHHDSALYGTLSCLVFGGVFAIAMLIYQLRRHYEQAEVMEHRASVLGERQRLAREMHDVLAHSLSGLMLQLEGARMLAKENPADPRLPEIIEKAHHLGKTGLAEARRAIGMLRDDDLPGPEQLDTLVRQFERDSGTRCRLAVSGAAHELDSEARLAIYRVAQEALTNIRKHARPDRVDVRLVYADDRTCLTVEDFAVNGRAAAVPAAPDVVKDSGGGYGLTGMRERAELLGGSLTTGPTATGFRVELQVPA
jgi:signal transduction histidine kinase